MPNARARAATSRPIRPKPMTPSILPRSSAPMNFFLSHSPRFIEASAAGIGAREREHQAHRELGDADAVGAGGVHDENAARGGGRHVDVVDAGAGARDHAQLRRGLDQRGGDLRRAADDQRVGVREIARQLVGFAAGFRVDGPAGGAKRVGGGGRKRISNDDVHVARL